ncbi:MAG: class I SAM-dependent methyltransferase [Ginsengibacter sp.]
MDTQLQAISDQQKESWNRFSGGWKKWNDFNMKFLKPMGDTIIKCLDISDNDIVLDIASGTGEPAFTIAALAKNGKVYATDVAAQMLDIAKEMAGQYNLQNIEFAVTDVSELPFDSDFFDKISCRMGFMFFPDMQLAANEMFRVCKSGGKIATSVWASPENNEWVTTVMKILSKNIEMPQPPPEAPGMFRCAKPGLIKEFFENAGFKDIKEETISGKVDYGTADVYWECMNDVAAPVVGALSKASDATKKKIKDDLFEVCNSMLTNNSLAMNYSATIISGIK